MTVIHARQGPDGMCISAKGHASGSPEACAAVSALLYALAGYLTNAEQDGKAQNVFTRLESGDAELRFCGGEAAQAAFRMAVIGLLQLAQAQPDCVFADFSEEN